MGGHDHVRMVDIIQKKRHAQELTKEEIRWFIDHYVSGEIPDYQASALAMAVCLTGMNEQETTELTLSMAESGQQLDWSDIPGIKVDKHSTGGVGDTTTLVLAPLVAAVGVPIAKMSGRGLGHTGGTIDKLESIPGFSTQLSEAQFRSQVQSIGVAIAAQTANLAPADKKLYALRDVTGTVESLPLIASSIMSKKMASGADAIVLDVKVGKGAFMKDVLHARQLAVAMVSIGRLAKRHVTAVLTEMEQPLGRAIGNALEVREAILTLRGQGPTDLTELCLTLGAEMVVLGGKAHDTQEARLLLEEALANGQALAKFKDWVLAQGGDPRVADDLALLPRAEVIRSWKADVKGVVTEIDAEQMGLVAMRLGAGRATHDDVINPAVGLVVRRKVGEEVLPGEPLVEVHAATPEAAAVAMERLKEIVRIADAKPFIPPLVLDVIRDGQLELGRLALGRSETPPESIQEALLAHAVAARTSAYVPYSHFAVGAALRLENGDIVTGANVENASYGLTNCAERTAVFHYVTSQAYQAGVKIVEVAVAADSEGPVAPCGACRQVLAEFCPPQTRVWLADMSGNERSTTVGELLPYAFGAGQMTPLS